MDTVEQTPAHNLQDDKRWKQALEKTIPAIVAIRFMTVRHFDTYGAGTSSATGFVVDAKRGIILTNRHVVRPGPVNANAIFSNHEETPIYALYYDPMHDFGFFRYDPNSLQFIEPREIKLAPEKAEVGMAIRVIGNDAGEKLSILGGTLARLDRQPPKYGVDNYNDHNTFYFQAASMTSGGSSGSPVIDVEGDAVALNAGAKTQAASSFYLPLDRVVRALRIIQQLIPDPTEPQDQVDAECVLRLPRAIPRGTIQTCFDYDTYDEVRRLGLPAEEEALFRQAFPHGTGMLTVSKVVRNGPGYKAGLKHGDILLRINGQLVCNFLQLESILDDHIAAASAAYAKLSTSSSSSTAWLSEAIIKEPPFSLTPLTVEVDRGGQTIQIEVAVQDLHDITPSMYVEYSGAVIHPVSYQQAINYEVPCEGIVVANPGYAMKRAGLGSGCVIESIASLPTPSLDEFERIISSLPDGKRVPIRYWSLKDKNHTKVGMLPIDRRWFVCQRRTRTGFSGLWMARPFAPVPEIGGNSSPSSSSASTTTTTTTTTTTSLLKKTTKDRRGSLVAAAGAASCSSSPQLALGNGHSGTPSSTTSSPSSSSPVVPNGQAQSNGNGVSSSSPGLPSKYHQSPTLTYSTTTIIHSPVLSSCSAPLLNPQFNSLELQSTTFPETSNPVAAKLVPSLVTVSFNVPYLLNGVSASQYTGTGLVISAENGLVVVDRNTVPYSLGDCFLVFAGSIQIPGRVLYCHPIHNVAVVQYDPILIGNTPVRSARLANTGSPLLQQLYSNNNNNNNRAQEIGKVLPPLEAGDQVWFIGQTGSSSLITRLSSVTKREKLGINTAEVPCFRAINVEVLHLDHTISSIGGVLADEDGTVRALWQSFTKSDHNQKPYEVSRGLPMEFVRDVLEVLIDQSSQHRRELLLQQQKELHLPHSQQQKNECDAPPLSLNGPSSSSSSEDAEDFDKKNDKMAIPSSSSSASPCSLTSSPIRVDYRSLEVELWTVPLFNARHLGLPNRWVDLLERQDRRRVALTVKRTVVDSPASRVLKEGDLLLAVQGRPLTRFLDLELLVTSPALLASCPSYQKSEQNTCKNTCSSCSRKNVNLDDDECCVGSLVSPSVANIATAVVLEERTSLGTQQKRSISPSFCSCECNSPTPSSSPATSIELTIWSEGREKVVEVPTISLHGQEIDRFVLWSGAFLQETYRELYLTQKDLPKGIYVSRYFLGSPSDYYNLKAKTWILEVNGHPTTNLNEFLQAVAGLTDEEFVRVHLVDGRGKVRVLTMKPDLHYWPTVEFRQDSLGSLDWGLRQLTQKNLLDRVEEEEMARERLQEWQRFHKSVVAESKVKPTSHRDKHELAEEDQHHSL